MNDNLQTFAHPRKPKHFYDRNKLLQNQLRDQKLSYPISAEYPLVLATEKADRSHCLFYENKIVAHLNLLPRQLVFQSDQNIINHERQIGLIGNVATAQGYHGKGYMTQLLDHVTNLARQQGLMGLVLWSDLDSFYQKRGFVSLGQEKRYRLRKNDQSSSNDQLDQTSSIARRNPINPDGMQFIPLLKTSLTPALLARLELLRYPTPLTIARSQEEFATLLQIPNLCGHLMSNNGQISAYALIGKGFDMQGVIHEWGACDHVALASLLDFLIDEAQPTQALTLLTPDSIDAVFAAEIAKRSLDMSTHPMCLFKPLNEPIANLDVPLSKLFIWGLDSI